MAKLKSEDAFAEKITETICKWFQNTYNVVVIEPGATPGEGYEEEQLKIEWKISIDDAKKGWSWTCRLDSDIKTQIISGLQKNNIDLYQDVLVSELPIINYDYAKARKKNLAFYGWLGFYKVR